jgi:hypothetical protein
MLGDDERAWGLAVALGSAKSCVGQRPMRFYRPVFFFALCGLLAWVPTRAQPTARPMLAGELGGTLKVFKFPWAPELVWRVQITSLADARLHLHLFADAPGARMQMRVAIDSNLGAGTWTLREGRLDPAIWLPRLAPQLSPTLAGAVAEGDMELRGDGVIRGGQLEGRMMIEWRRGAVRHATQGWALEDIALEGDFIFEQNPARWSSVSPLRLTIGSITTGRFGARNLLVRAQIDERLLPQIEEARVEIAGGEIEAAPFTLPLSPLMIQVALTIRRIGLADAVALVPTGLAEAQGRVQGALQLGWSKALGLQIGAGRLDLVPDEPMMLRLAPAPGLLSASVPERFALLPAWLGPMTRRLAPLNPGYADLVAIELGRTALKVESLEVRLTPEGDVQGHSARVLIQARPALDGTSVGPVSFEIGVKGPLAYVLRLGAENGSTLSLR